MKKILIVNNNLQIGGIQKSLVNLLREVSDDYEITLMLFANYGSLVSQIPENVRIVYSSWAFRTLGIPWNELKKNPFLVAHKALITVMNKIFGKGITVKYLSMFQKKISGYDTVISYSHCTNEKTISICCPEFVLNCTNCAEKICFIHCDYQNSNTSGKYNNSIYRRFSKIACCSDSVKDRLLNVIPDLKDRTYTVRNFLNLDIVELAKDNPVDYDSQYLNIVSCARLSVEKGIERALEAIKGLNRNDIRYYIIGDGPEKSKLISFVEENGLTESVFFYGEQINPYRYIYNVDYLLVPSFHEAAPIVFDEANTLGLCIISTNTTSAEEMLTENDIICENSVAGIRKALISAQRNRSKIPALDNNLNRINFDIMLNS